MQPTKLSRIEENKKTTKLIKAFGIGLVGLLSVAILTPVFTTNIRVLEIEKDVLKRSDEKQLPYRQGNREVQEAINRVLNQSADPIANKLEVDGYWSTKTSEAIRKIVNNPELHSAFLNHLDDVRKEYDNKPKGLAFIYTNNMGNTK